MDFVPTADQAAVVDAVATIADRHGGPERLRTLGGDAPGYDHDLHGRLAEAGFLDLPVDDPGDRVGAALVIEALAARLAATAHGYHLLVTAGLGLDNRGALSVVTAGHRGPARFAADATTVVVIDREADEVRVREAEPGSVTRTTSRLGWPAGDIDDTTGGDRLAGASPDQVHAWWNIALALELVGTMSFAVDLTVDHVSGRNQFGRPIGSFQAVQHGLAECAVALEGARWLSREAAWSGTAEAASAALTHALGAARQVFRATHQYTGALGFTTEYDLHLATMRLQALRVEATQAGRPAVALARQQWGLA